MYLVPVNYNTNNGSQPMRRTSLRRTSLAAAPLVAQSAIISPSSNYSNPANINTYQVITPQSVSNWIVLNNNNGVSLYFNTDNNIVASMHINSNNPLASPPNQLISDNAGIINVNNNVNQPQAMPATPTPTPSPPQNGNAFCCDLQNSEIRQSLQPKIKNETKLNNESRRPLQSHSNVCFQCKYCPQQFATKQNLKQHQPAHSKEKPYQCSFCQKCFSQRYRLRDHIRTHTGERPFQCNICWKRFSLKHNLTVHKRIHTKKK